MNPIPYHTLIHQITCIEYACLYLFLLFLKKFMFLNSKVFSQPASQPAVKPAGSLTGCQSNNFSQLPSFQTSQILTLFTKHPYSECHGPAK